MGVAQAPPTAGAPAGRHRPVAARPATGAVVLAFVPTGERALGRVAGLSVGLMSATQGSYTRAQMLLDIGQGSRIASSSYDPTRAPRLSLSPGTASAPVAGSGATIAGWGGAVARAQAAPQLLRP